MNDMLESQLRAALQREAATVGEPADPVGSIHRRIGTRRRHRRGAAAIGSIATVGLAVGGFILLSQRRPAVDQEHQGSAPSAGVAAVAPDVPFLVPSFVPAELSDRRATEWSSPGPEINPLQETLYVYRRPGETIGYPTILVAVQPPVPGTTPVGPITESGGVATASGLAGNQFVSITARGIESEQLEVYIRPIIASIAGDTFATSIDDLHLVATYDDAGAGGRGAVSLEYSAAGPEPDYHPGISIYTLRGGSGATFEYEIVEPGTSIERTEVRGHPALAIRGGDSGKMPDQDLSRITRLIWEEAPGLSVGVTGIDYDIDVLRQVAQSLAPVDRATWVAMLGATTSSADEMTASTIPRVVAESPELFDDLLSLFPPRVMLVSDGWTLIPGDLSRFSGGVKGDGAATSERVWRDPGAGLWDRFVVVRAEPRNAPDYVGQPTTFGWLHESVSQIDGVRITLSSFGLSDDEHQVATQAVHQSIAESGTLPDSIGLATDGSPWASFAAPDKGGTIGFREERVVSYADVGAPAGPGAYASIRYERSDAVDGSPSVEIHSQVPDQLWSLIVDRMHGNAATIERVDVGGIPQAIQAIDLRLEELSGQIAELGPLTDEPGTAELNSIQSQYREYARVRVQLEARLELDPTTAGYDAALITLPAEDRHWLIWRQEGATVEVDIQGLSTEEVKRLIPGLVERDQETWNAAIIG